MNDPLRSDPLGHRARIGVLVPATNTIVQPEFEAMRPPGVTLHTARMRPAARPTDDAAAYRASIGAGGLSRIEEALPMLLAIRPHAIVLGHSLDAYADGLGGAERLRLACEAAGGVPFVVPPLALVDGIRALDRGTRVAVLTPYFPPGDELVAAFLAEAGLDVRRIVGLCCAGPLAIAATSTARIREAMRSLDGPDVDLLIQSGTNLAVASIADALEAECSKPVVSVNAACMWSVLRRLGIQDRREGFGSLLATGNHDGASVVVRRHGPGPSDRLGPP